ncbi:MAG: hypothetical protein U9N11_06630 [Campylobacterota bacterium]|nr:hypothetical protein [Campylobacterota bacterium]
MNINMQDKSDECTKRFLDKAEHASINSANVPLNAIKRYCRMLTVYCDAEGKVTDSFVKSMEKCAEEIILVEGMEEIFNTCNQCLEA